MGWKPQLGLHGYRRLMTGRFRALLGALTLVVAIAAAGAFYVGWHALGGSASIGEGGLQVATTGDVRDLFRHQGDDAQLLNVALRKLENSFYRPVDPQQPIAGERKAIAEFLKTKKIDNAMLPSEMATGDPVADGHRLERLLTFAQEHYAPRLGTTGKLDLTETALRGIMKS